MKSAKTFDVALCARFGSSFFSSFFSSSAAGAGAASSAAGGGASSSFLSFFLLLVFFSFVLLDYRQHKHAKKLQWHHQQIKSKLRHHNRREYAIMTQTDPGDIEDSNSTATNNSDDLPDLYILRWPHLTDLTDKTSDDIADGHKKN